MSPTEVLGIEIKQYVGDGDLKTLVPRIVGQTEQARIQKIGGGRSSSAEVDWDHYEAQLRPERLVILKEIYERMEKAVAHYELPWHPKLKRDEVVFQRAGGYNCCGIYIYKEQPIQFWIKLPFRLEELRARDHDVPDLYPELERRWESRYKQLCWEVPENESIPDIGPAIQLTSRHQPVTGPMTMQTG